MNRVFQIGLILAGCLSTVPMLRAQSTPAPPQPKSTQNKPTGDPQPPGQDMQKPSTPSSNSNPFPEDTSAVPVVPTTATPAAPPPPDNHVDSGLTSLLGDDTDPIHSPDDPTPGSPSASDSGSSSSLQGTEDLRIPPDVEKPGKRSKGPEPNHQETAAENVNVGGFYLDRKNWKAALSRFEAALVLDPENPDVYWGLAEAQRQLGDFANAKANYTKVMEYDPDSKHGKEAKKFLKQPELAHAPAVSANQPSIQQPQQ
jgi:hypothetical protein